jgi:hypothetical protein
MTSEGETRRRCPHRDSGALWGMARAEATRRQPPMTLETRQCRRECQTESARTLGNKRNPEGALTNLHPLGALTSHQVEPEGPTQVGLRHCSEDLCRRPSSPRDSLNPKAVGCLSDGSTTRRSPAGSILSDPAGETAVLLLRVDPHARSEVSLRPCGACRFPSKHKRNVDHSKTLVFDFGSPNFASR